MEMRFLGGQKVSLLGLGTGRLASLGAGYRRSQAAECLRTAAENGLNLIDTADSYGSGDCERLLGRLLREIRHPFLISTKAGYTYCRLPAFLSPLNQIGKKILQKVGPRQCFFPTTIRQRLEESLKRLRRERVEFYFLHDPTPEALRDDDLTAELQKAKEHGKIGEIGISFSSTAATQIPRDHPFSSLLQTQINPWIPLSLRGNHEIIANHVFGGEKILQDDGRLESLATKEGLTPRQLLIAFAAQQKGVSTVLVGTGRAEHLRENLGGVGKKLSPATLTSLTELGRGKRV